MTRRTDIAWLKDINEAIEKIEQHPQYSKGHEGYIADEYFRGWVYLQTERICEAVTHLCNEHNYDSRFSGIPWEKIVGMRIILSHCYWNIDDDIIWNVVQQHLPLLKARVKEWLKH